MSRGPSVADVEAFTARARSVAERLGAETASITEGPAWDGIALVGVVHFDIPTEPRTYRLWVGVDGLLTGAERLRPG